MEAKSIERIAEELGVNFYDLHPLIAARDEYMKQEGRREVVEWLRTKQMPDEPSSYPYPGLVAISKVQFEAKLKEWGI